MDSLLHPAVGTINSWGPCGLFTSDLPELPAPRREFGAAMLGEDLVICGGYGFLNVQKVRLDIGLVCDLISSGLCRHQHWNLASGVENFSLDDSRQVRENICDDNLVRSSDI